MQFEKYRSFCLILFIVVFMPSLSYGQLSEYIKDLKIQELTTLENGVLLVELSNSPKDSTSNELIKTYVDSLYSFSSFYFFYEINDRDSLPNRVYNSDGSIENVTLIEEDVFIMRFYQEKFSLLEDWRFLTKKDEAILRPIEEKMAKTSYEKELDLFSTDNTESGGAIITKYVPILKKMQGKKRIIADFYFFARFHNELPDDENYQKTIERLVELIDERKKSFE